ncbi:MAG TPA: hypothetical protein VHW24_20950 [Bryobacteraceae bacterium]|jgi:hypothetical protein|nr:hypothetical protein [Bryobacteraceae bacterium]
MTPEPNQPDTSSFALGCLLAFGATIAAVVLGLIVVNAINRASTATLIPFTAFGLIQLIYIVPLVVWLRRRGDIRAAAGVITFAAVVFLLNAACWGFMTSMRP